MIANKLKRTSQNIYFQYTVLFLVICGFILLPFQIQGRSLISQYDALAQHYVALTNIKKMLIEVFTKGFRFSDLWQWNLGIGSDQFQVYSYYGLGDIFTYIVLFFRSPDRAYNVIMLAKLFTAGIGMVLFLDSKKIYNRFGVLSATVFYTFCGYTVHAVSSHPMFLTPMVIIPFFLYSIDLFLANQKKYLITIVVGWALISNFYFAVFTLICGAIYFILENYSKNTSLTKKNLAMLTVIPYLLIGFLLSAVVFFPSVYAFLHSTRAEVPFANGLKHFQLRYYLNFLNVLIMPPTDRSFEFHGGFSVFIFPSVVYSLSHFKRYFKVNFSLLLILLGLFSPQVASIVNGGASPSIRWGFLLAIPLSIILANFVTNLKKVSVKELKKIAIISSGLGFIAIIGFQLSVYNNLYAIILIMTMMFSLLLIYLAQNQLISESKLYGLFLLLICLNVAFNGNYYNQKSGNDYASTHMKKGSPKYYYENYFAGLDKEINQTTDNFSRISYTKRFNNPDFESEVVNRHNVGAFLDYRLTSSYFSLQNENLGSFTTYIGNSDTVMTEPIRRLDNRTMLNNYIGVEYMFSKEASQTDVPFGFDLISKKETDDETVYLSKTTNNFPLLFTLEDVKVLEEDYIGIGVIEEQGLAEYIAVESNFPTQGLAVVNSPSKSVKEIPITIDESDPKKIKLTAIDDEKDVEGEYLLSIGEISITDKNFVERRQSYREAREENESLSKMDMIKREIAYQPTGHGYQFYVGEELRNRIYQFSPINVSSYAPITKTLVNLGKSTAIDLAEGITIEIESPADIDLKKIKVVKSDYGQQYSNHVKNIQNSSLTDIKVNNGLITGSTDNQNPQVMAGSIPYSEGWKIEIDGKEVESFKVNSGFLGALIPEGKHNIQITYETPLLKISIALTVIGLLATSIIVIIERFTNKKSRK